MYSYNKFKEYLISCGEIKEVTQIKKTNTVYKDNKDITKGIRYYLVKTEEGSFKRWQRAISII